MKICSQSNGTHCSLVSCLFDEYRQQWTAEKNEDVLLTPGEIDEDVHQLGRLEDILLNLSRLAPKCLRAYL